MITRIKEIDGRYYPQVMFKLFWFIPTGWWRNCAELCYDIIDGECIYTICYKTKQQAEDCITTLVSNHL